MAWSWMTSWRTSQTPTECQQACAGACTLAGSGRRSAAGPSVSLGGPGCDITDIPLAADLTSYNAENFGKLLNAFFEVKPPALPCTLQLCTHAAANLASCF